MKFKENLIQNEDHSDPYVRISNDGYINPSVVVGDRMVTEIERITNDIIASKYWGNPEFVLRNLIPHRIKMGFQINLMESSIGLETLLIFLADMQGLVV